MTVSNPLPSKRGVGNNDKNFIPPLLFKFRITLYTRRTSLFPTIIHPSNITFNQSIKMAKASKSAPPAAAAKANVEKKEKKSSKAAAPAPVAAPAKVSLLFLLSIPHGSSIWDLV